MPPKGYRHTDAAKAAISKARMGKKKSEETKARMSKAKSGKNHPLYGRRGKDSAVYGRKHTEADKEAMRDAWTEERKARQSARMKDNKLRSAAR